MRDMVLKNRSAKINGELNGGSKLSFEKVKLIKKSINSTSEMAKMFNVGKSTILRIKNRQSWKNYA